VARIQKSTRETVKRGAQFPAVVTEAMGPRASARLSGNGAIIHNLVIVGGPVEIGEKVMVDYTTPEPTIVAVSKEWLTLADIERMIKKREVPIIEVPETEFNKIVTYRMQYVQHDYGGDPWNHYYNQEFVWWDPPDKYGLWLAEGHAWDDEYYDETDYHRYYVIRFPPMRFNYDDRDYMVEWSNVPGCHWFGDSRDSTIFNLNMAAGNSSTVKDMTFLAQSTYQWLSAYNWYMWFIDPDDWPEGFEHVHGDGTSYFENCKFVSLTYNGYDPWELQPDEYDYGQPYANFWFYSRNDGVPASTDVIFYNCEFISRTNPRSTWPARAFLYDEDHRGPSYDNVTWNVYLYNCVVDAEDTPIHDSPKLNVFSIDTKWIGVPDLTALPVTFLDTSDRAAIDHGGDHGDDDFFEANAIHTNVPGEF